MTRHRHQNFINKTILATALALMLAPTVSAQSLMDHLNGGTANKNTAENSIGKDSAEKGASKNEAAKNEAVSEEIAGGKQDPAAEGESHQAAGAPVRPVSTIERGISASESLPPPSAPPASLPPIPGQSNPSGPVGAPPPPSALPSTQVATQAPTPGALPPGFDPAFDANRLEQMLMAETTRMQSAVAQQFHLALLRTDDPQFQAYVASGLLKRDVNEYAETEHGLSATLIMGGSYNGRPTPVCYVLYQPNQSEHIWNKFVVPLARDNHPQTGAAYLIGHETGHCLDQHQRFYQLSRKLKWESDEMTALGLRPEAVYQVLGGSFSKAALNQRMGDVLRHPAQRQFTERVADAFAVAWVLKLGANKPAVMQALRVERGKHGPAGSHSTGPILDYITQNLADVTRVQRVDVLWDFARNTQIKVGIDPATLTAVAHQDQPSGHDQSEPKISHWVVTSRGPVPVDKNGNEIPQENQRRSGRNFNDLPRFGSKK